MGGGSRGRGVSLVIVIVIVAVVAVAAVLPPANTSAVVNGRTVAESAAPWFVGTGICGGTLIAPDRIATAAHCFDPIDMSDIRRIRVGSEARRGVRVALPSTWRTRRADFALDDIAIVQLDRPVAQTRPARLPSAGSRLPGRVRVLGRGQITAPAAGKRPPPGVFRLREATLRTVGDAVCATTWRRSKTKYRTRFAARLMLCAGDVDGRPPLQSVCAGDSGGPLVSGSLTSPVLLGVISWTGPRCGADRLPTVAAEVNHYREFLNDPNPRWAPVPGGPTRVTGESRAGGTLSCEIPPWEVAADEIEIRWLRRTKTARSYEFSEVGTGASYTVQPADAGLLLRCDARGSGPAGRTVVPSGPESAVRIAG